MVDGPACEQHCPAPIAFLLTLPFSSLETETIFAPSADYPYMAKTIVEDYCEA
jgi:hypothetical protein